jgi:predicted MFS family arabinose efflux permease
MANARLLAFMIAAQIFAMLGSSAVAATLPTLIAQWHLSSTEAGWMSGAYFLGYAIAVPTLVSLTDRVDARVVFACGCAIGLAACIGFALFANGLWTATIFWTLAGISLAAVYMPGLRVIIDRIDAAIRLRAVPYYTASFGVGISASFFVAGSAAQAYGWRAAFVAGALGCVAAIACLVLATVHLYAKPVERRGNGTFNLRAVLRNAAALRYIVAYGGHCWELFALRSWLVALLLFMWNANIGVGPGPALTYWSAVIALVGVPASILGAETALKFGRRRLIAIVAIASVAIALVTAWSGPRSFAAGALALVFYNVAILGDSGALTAGVVDAASPDAQGSTLALHSLVGFVGGGLGPIAVGAALAFAGGPTSEVGWAVALATMAAGSALAALAVVGVSK